MKLKEGFILTEIGGEYVAVPSQGGAGSFHGIVKLNESGKDIWQGLEEGLSEEKIADRLVELYENLDRNKALNAVKSVIEELKTEGLLVE